MFRASAPLSGNGFHGRQPALDGAFDLLATRGTSQLGLQIERSPLPIRFEKAEWNRMHADAERWGWRFTIASVAEQRVTFLDPERARIGREVRLHQDAVIDNVLRWLEP